jgi:hypothetical protein
MRRVVQSARLTARQWQLLGADWEANVIANVSSAENVALAESLSSRWNAVLDALAEYDDPTKSLTSTTATRMADILRTAV